MLAIGFRFPAGRYHATPWGRHVNEADVEWPPSPWRILRSLIATWHRKISPSEASDDPLSKLVECLAQEPPTYYLPRATRAHSRHYMPVREGKKDKPVLIFDAFIKLNLDDEVVAIWPGSVLLDGTQLALLDELLANTGYLGRAESWVEARRIPDWSEEPNCSQSEVSIDPETGEAHEPVSIVCPLTPGEYGQWRSRTAEEHGLAAKKLSKGQKTLLATLPERFVDALRLDTGNIQRAGWSLPPGARFAIYQRPYHCFVPDRQPQRKRRGGNRSITTARLALSGKPLPRIEGAVKIGELVRMAAMSRAECITGARGVPPALSGHDMPAGNRHSHAFYLPECRDGRISHVLVHAEAGLDGQPLRALDRIPRIWQPDGSEWRVILESYGGRVDFARHPYLDKALVWKSVTPYLHPWFRKKNFTVEDQIRRECRERGLPEPDIEPLDFVSIKGRERRPVHFYRFRSRRSATQPDTKGSFWKLTFPEPIQGPIALGFGCHFGLGIFEIEK
jgi:CRISPR-associated protein Csb2